jgi:competence protein ComEA
LKVADVPEPKRYEEVVDESVAGSVTARAAGPGGAGPVVPQKSAANDGAKGTKGAAGGLLNVNTATQAELELLPGIGPALASRIVEYRTAKGPFRSMSDLDAVSGIGPKMLEKLKPLVRFE